MGAQTPTYNLLRLPVTFTDWAHVHNRRSRQDDYGGQVSNCILASYCSDLKPIRTPSLGYPQSLSVSFTKSTMIITTGIQNSPVVSRLELRTFLQDKEVTNLYVLATDQMMRIPQDDLSSWFQIAAIHGRCVDLLMLE